MTPQHHPKQKMGKFRLSLIEPDFLTSLIATMEYGEAKYPGKSYQLAPDSAQAKIDYTDAAFRHLLCIMRGQDKDPESGLPHAAHVAANMMMVDFHSKPKEVTPESETQRSDMEVIDMFLFDCTESDHFNNILLSELYDAYIDYCETWDHSPIFTSSQKLRSVLVDRGIDVKKGNGSKYHVFSLRLIP